jgi:hypothetical protein
VHPYREASSTLQLGSLGRVVAMLQGVLKTGALNRSVILSALISLAFLTCYDFEFGRCYHFATECLLRLRLYLTPDRSVNLFRRVRLHSRHDMGVEVERDADRGMSKALAGNLRMDAGRKHLRGMGMA